MWIARTYCVGWISLFVLPFGALAAQPAGDAAADKSLTLPPTRQVLVLEGRAGKVGGGLDLQFGKSGRETPKFELRAQDMVAANHHWRLTSATPEKFPDACLSLSLTAREEYERPVRRAYFIRPDVHFYLPDDQAYKEALANWAKLPPASQHFFRLEIARRYGRVELTIDGRFFSSFADKPEYQQLTVRETEGGEVLEIGEQKDTEEARFLPVNVSATNHQDDVSVQSTSFQPGMQTIAAKPMRVAGPEAHVDVGLARWLRQASGGDSYYDPYYRRSAWDSLPETIIFSVPKRHYNTAHVLCAVRTDGGRAPIMSVRMARYRQAWDGSGATQADTNVRVDPKQPQGCDRIQQVGEITADVSGKRHTLPLYLVEIPLRTGELADVFHMEGTDFNETTDFFSVELTRQLRLRRTVNHSNHEWKPLGPQSGIIVLGLTLEKSPVAIRIESEETGYVFYKHKKPALTIATTNPSDGLVFLDLSVTVTDYSGEQREVTQSLTVPPGTLGMCCIASPTECLT